MSDTWNAGAARRAVSMPESDIKVLYRAAPACFLEGAGWRRIGGGGSRRFDDLFVNRDGRVALVEAKKELHGDLTIDRKNSLMRKLVSGGGGWTDPDEALRLVIPRGERAGVQRKIDDYLGEDGAWAKAYLRPELHIVCSRATRTAIGTFDALVRPHLAGWLASATLIVVSKVSKSGGPQAMRLTIARPTRSGHADA